MIIYYIIKEKCCLVRYLNPSNHHLARIKKADKDFAKRLDLKDLKLSVKIRNFQKSGKKVFVSISVLGYKNKGKHPIYLSKQFSEQKHVDLLLKGAEEKKTLCSDQRF